MKLSRRQSLAASLLALPLATLAARPALGAGVEDRLAALEARQPGRLCVAILDLGSGRRSGHRADEPMLLCSTFKALAAAFVLARVDRGAEQLDRRIVFAPDAVLPGWSPVTAKRSGAPGMTVAELCDAVVTLSDNTAANLLLQSFGGPAALTAFCRDLGDTVTRLDRIEPELNNHDGPQDRRDTTTANAMLDSLRRLIFDEVLSGPSRSQFAAWLIANKTGDRQLRAGMPAGWLVGDKTGSNGDAVGNVNDVAVIWPADRAPLIVTAYCVLPSLERQQRYAVLAEIGRIAAAG